MKGEIMKNHNGILVAIITATTLLLFIPISAYAEETWELILDSGRGQANLTLIQKQNGTITADGNWVYTYQASNVSGTFTAAPVIITGSSISIEASGTATNPSAPPGYKTSPFTLSISGTACNGQGNGTFTMTFQTAGWPNSIVGSWEGTRTSGSGITAEAKTAEAKAMPWIPFLLLSK